MGVFLVCSVFLAKPASAKLDLYFDYENVSTVYVKFVNEFGPLFLDFYKKNEKLIKGNHKVYVYEAVEKKEKLLVPYIVIILDDEEHSPVWHVANQKLKDLRATKRAARAAIRTISVKLKKISR